MIANLKYLHRSLRKYSFVLKNQTKGFNIIFCGRCHEVFLVSIRIIPISRVIPPFYLTILVVPAIMMAPTNDPGSRIKSLQLN